MEFKDILQMYDIPEKIKKINELLKDDGLKLDISTGSIVEL